MFFELTSFRFLPSRELLAFNADHLYRPKKIAISSTAFYILLHPDLNAQIVSLSSSQTQPNPTNDSCRQSSSPSLPSLLPCNHALGTSQTSPSIPRTSRDLYSSGQLLSSSRYRGRAERREKQTRADTSASSLSLFLPQAAFERFGDSVDYEPRETIKGEFGRSWDQVERWEGGLGGVTKECSEGNPKGEEEGTVELASFLAFLLVRISRERSKLGSTCFSTEQAPSVWLHTRVKEQRNQLPN